MACSAEKRHILPCRSTKDVDILKHGLISALAYGAILALGAFGGVQAGAQGLFSHDSGTYSTTQLVRIEGGEVHFTTDGTDPTAESPVYDGVPIVVECSTEIRAAAMEDGALSDVEVLDIKIRTPAPSASLASGTYGSAQSVRLTCDKGCTIYYTTDGTKPTKKSAKYTKPIAIDESATLRFFAVKNGLAKSAVITRKYVISADVYDEAERQELFELVNEERAKYGLSPLTELPELSAIAQRRAVECSSYFSHRRADGTKWEALLAEAGLKRSSRAENICYYHMTARQALDSWLADYAHRKNILDPEMKYIGIGYYHNGYCGYWTQLFIGD